MNAHNEQHDPASPVVKQNLTTQPAAAQEAVACRYRSRRKNGEFFPWLYADKLPTERHENSQYELLYAAPVTAAPYSIDADPLGIRATVADCITGALMVGALGHAKPPEGNWLLPFWEMARADAQTAHGIDLADLADTWVRSNPDPKMTVRQALSMCARSLRDAMIDASPKGALNEQFGSAEGLESPKGGSEARDAARYRWLRESRGVTWDEPWVAVGHYGRPYDQQPNEIEGQQLDDAIDAAMKAQAGDAEVQPLCDLCRKRPEAHSDAEGIGFCEVCWDEWMQANSHGQEVQP